MTFAAKHLAAQREINYQRTTMLDRIIADTHPIVLGVEVVIARECSTRRDRETHGWIVEGILSYAIGNERRYQLVHCYGGEAIVGRSKILGSRQTQ
jgi:hypothetical protein